MLRTNKKAIIKILQGIKESANNADNDSISETAREILRDLNKINTQPTIEGVKDLYSDICEFIYNKGIVDQVGFIYILAWDVIDALSVKSIVERFHIVPEYYYSNIKDKNFDIPSGVVKLEGPIFYNCYDLETITVPKSVKVIDSYIYSDCPRIKTVNIPKELKKFNFFNTNRLDIIYY